MKSLRFPLRVLGLIVGLTIGFLAGDVLSAFGDDADPKATLLLIAFSIGGIGYVLGPHVSWAIFRNLRTKIAESSTLDLVAIALGFTFGALVGALLAIPLSFLPSPFGKIVPFVIAIMTCSLGTAVTLLRKRDLIAPFIGNRLAKGSGADEPPTPARSHDLAILLDTNIVIDGRVVELAGSGFLSGLLLIPRFVLDELQ